MKKPFSFSRTYLYFLVVTVVASVLTLILVNMTNRVYSFVPDTTLLEEKETLHN